MWAGLDSPLLAFRVEKGESQVEEGTIYPEPVYRHVALMQLWLCLDFSSVTPVLDSVLPELEDNKKCVVYYTKFMIIC